MPPLRSVHTPEIYRQPPESSSLMPHSQCVTTPMNFALKYLPNPSVFHHLHDYHPSPNYHTYSAGLPQQPPNSAYSMLQRQPGGPFKMSTSLRHPRVWRFLVLPTTLKLWAPAQPGRLTSPPHLSPCPSASLSSGHTAPLAVSGMHHTPSRPRVLPVLLPLATMCFFV